MLINHKKISKIILGCLASLLISCCAILLLPHPDARIDKSVAKVEYDTGRQADKRVEHAVHHKNVIVKQIQ